MTLERSLPSIGWGSRSFRARRLTLVHAMDVAKRQGVDALYQTVKEQPQNIVRSVAWHDLFGFATRSSWGELIEHKAAVGLDVSTLIGSLVRGSAGSLGLN